MIIDCSHTGDKSARGPLPAVLWSGRRAGRRGEEGGSGVKRKWRKRANSIGEEEARRGGGELKE